MQIKVFRQDGVEVGLSLAFWGGGIYLRMETRDRNGFRCVSGDIRRTAGVEIYYMTPLKLGLYIPLDQAEGYTIDRHGQYTKHRTPRFVCITDQALAQVVAGILTQWLGIRLARNADPDRKVSHAA